MPNFSVPNNINAGDPLDATKAMANWNQVVTDLNGAKIDATNTAATFAKDVVEPAFSGYKTVAVAFANVPSGNTGQIILGNPGGFNGGSLLHLDPADFTAGSRTTKYRVRATCQTNGTAPAWVAANIGLYAVTATSGGVLTLGSFAVGVNIGSPSANTLTHAESADTAAPAAGFYCLACTFNSPAAVGSSSNLAAVLQVRQV